MYNKNNEIENLVDRLSETLKQAGYEGVVVLVACQKEKDDQVIVNDCQRVDLAYAILSAPQIFNNN